MYLWCVFSSGGDAAFVEGEEAVCVCVSHMQLCVGWTAGGNHSPERAGFALVQQWSLGELGPPQSLLGPCLGRSLGLGLWHGRDRCFSCWEGPTRRLHFREKVTPCARVTGGGEGFPSPK